MNSRPPPCEGDALPAELLPHMDATTRRSEMCMPFMCRGQVFFAEGQPVGRRSALAQKLRRQGCVSHALSAFSLSSQKGMGNGLSWHRAGEVSLPGSGQFFDGGLPALAYPHPCLWRAGMIGVPRRHLPGVQVWRSLCRHSPRLCSLSSILASRAVHGQDRTAGRRLPSLRVALRISPSGARCQHARLLVCRNGRPA